MAMNFHSLNNAKLKTWMKFSSVPDASLFKNSPHHC